MKKLFIYFTVLCISLLILSACSPGPETENGYGGDSMEFESFNLTMTGTMAHSDVYAAQKTEGGVHLEHYIETSMWDDALARSVDIRHTIREIDGDEALYKELCAIFGNCRIDKWAGFRGENPPEVLDGSSMSFNAVLADGTKVDASGSNNFPKNYRIFVQEIQQLINEEKISKVKFRGEGYEVTLPESWIGVVTAEYSDGMVAFSVEQNDGKLLTFCIIDDNSFGYSSDSYEGCIDVGRLVSEDDVRFITVRDHYGIAAYADKVSEDALELWENYESDKLALVESFHGIDGYELYPENGDVLYESEAMRLADDARSLWLYLNFAGEYAGGAKPTIIDGRSYIVMFPQDKGVYTIEAVHDELLTVFSEEFTDKIINKAVEDKDLIEYNDDVYVAFKKKAGNESSNGWVDSVRDEGDGRYTVVMAVRRPGTDTLEYLDFPTEKNAEGKFVFSAYPYWDESE